MRFYSMMLFLLAAVLMMAKTDGIPGQRVEIRTSNSLVEIIGFDGDEVTVDDATPGTVKYVDGRVVVEGDGWLRIHVPRQSSLDVVTSNGEINVAGVAGSMLLTTSNGSIVVLDGGSGGIRAHTSNGRIEVGVTRGVNGSVSARTTNARIHSDLKLSREHIGTTFLEGRMGAGGPAIDLQTSNGAIYLKHAGYRESFRSTFESAPDAAKLPTGDVISAPATVRRHR